MHGTHLPLLCATPAGHAAGMCLAPAGAAPLPIGARRMPAPRLLRRSAVAAPGMIEAVM